MVSGFNANVTWLKSTTKIFVNKKSWYIFLPKYYKDVNKDLILQKNFSRTFEEQISNRKQKVCTLKT